MHIYTVTAASARDSLILKFTRVGFCDLERERPKHLSVDLENMQDTSVDLNVFPLGDRIRKSGM